MIFWPRIGYSFASWLRAGCFKNFQPSPFDKLRAGSSGLDRVSEAYPGLRPGLGVVQFDLKNASVQQPLFMNRCPFLVIPSKEEVGFHEDSVMIGGGCGPVGAGHTNGAPQVPRLPRISCRELPLWSTACGSL
jgi:hypothetical protein